jgi:hypothetical protein
MIKILVSISLSAMVLLAGCGGAGPVALAPTETLAPPLAATANQTPPPADTSTPAPPPTDTQTPTPSVPVFDPAALGDNRVLDSFILTRRDKTTGGGEVIETKDTIGFIKEPFSASHVETNPYGHPPEQYFLDGRMYEKNYNQDFWVVSLEPEPSDVDFYFRNAADSREGYPKYLVLSAQFAGHEDFQGIPANHFTFAETDLSEQSDPTGTYKIKDAQGDLYLAQDGNYLLRFHVKLTGNVYSPGGSPGYISGVHEVTEELSSIDQLKDITLPKDFLALKLELDPGLPAPAGSRLHAITHANVGADYDLYNYFIPASVSKDDFLGFYRNLAPTNGWTVTQVGGITNDETCQTGDCVILEKGRTRVSLEISDQCVSTIPANYVCFYGVYYK